jgi:hypothetical protein
VINIEDREYFDVLYQGWSKTTGAEDMFWMPEEDEGHYAGGPGTFNVYAVNEAEEKKFIASFEREEDSAFIVAAHGSISDLIRRLHMALDEADRLDVEKDEAICRVAQLELEADEFESIIGDLTEKLANMESGRV